MKVRGAGNGVVVTVLILLLIAVVGFGSWLVAKQNIQGTTIGTAINPQTGATTQPIITSSTTLSLGGVDKAQTGISVGVTPYIAVGNNPFKTGITSASQGQKLKILFVNNTQYHNAYISDYTVPAVASDVITAQLNKNASIVMKWYNSDGTNLLTNGGGAVNQTVSTGGAYTMKFTIDGQDQASTQDMRCILESSDATKAEKMVLSGFGAVDKGQSKPNWYTLSGVNAGVWVFDIAPISGAGTTVGSIYISSKTGQSLAGTTAKISCYTKEYFLDSYTGTVSYDVEDSRGNLQSIASYTYTIAFN